jgi:hypothetical protein
MRMHLSFELGPEDGASPAQAVTVLKAILGAYAEASAKVSAKVSELELVPAKPQEGREPAPLASPVPAASEAAAPSLDDVRDALIRLGRTTEKTAPKALLAELGVKTVSNLTEEQRALILARCQQRMKEKA